MRPERIARTDVEAQLARALAASAAAAGIAAGAQDHRMRPWSSATFTGAQHRLTLRAVRTPALDAWIAGLGDAELALRGHVVASVAVERVDDDGEDRAAVRLALAVLTLEDG